MLTYLNCAAQELKKNYVFAEIKQGNFIILKDTAKLKSEIVELMFSDSANQFKPNFDRLEVRKLSSFGDTSIVYYSYLLTDNKNHIKVSKWLEKIGNKLYVIDDPKEEDMEKLYYFACIGKDDCFPEIRTEGKEKNWTCWRDKMCKVKSNCIRIISIY